MILSKKGSRFIYRYNSFYVRCKPGVGDIELMCGIDITEDDFEYVDYLDEEDRLEDLIVLVPMYDWGETCPSCEIGMIEDIDMHQTTALVCSNCGFVPPWRYGSYRWQQGKPKEISKLSVQNLLEADQDF